MQETQDVGVCSRRSGGTLDGQQAALCEKEIKMGESAAQGACRVAV